MKHGGSLAAKHRRSSPADLDAFKSSPVDSQIYEVINENSTNSDLNVSLAESINVHRTCYLNEANGDKHTTDDTPNTHTRETGDPEYSHTETETQEVQDNTVYPFPHTLDCTAIVYDTISEAGLPSSCSVVVEHPTEPFYGDDLEKECQYCEQQKPLYYTLEDSSENRIKAASQARHSVPYEDVPLVAEADQTSTSCEVHFINPVYESADAGTTGSPIL